MAKYIVIKKDTGKIYAPHVHEDTSFPINSQELEFVQITNEMLASLEGADRIIDFQNTTYNNGAWSVTFVTPQKVDIFQNRTNDKAKLIAEANRKLTISDLPEGFKDSIRSYLIELNNIIITRDDIQQITWPEKPW